MADFFEAGITNMVREGGTCLIFILVNIIFPPALSSAIAGEILKVYSGENQKEMVFSLDKNN